VRRAPPRRYCYAIQQRVYLDKGEPRYTSGMLHEFTRAEWAEIQARQGPMLDHYDRVGGQEAHDWVRRDRPHSTGLYIDDGRIRYAASDPDC
jgi:hypothetical protein